MVQRDIEQSVVHAADQPAQRIGRRLIRAIALSAFVFALFPLAKAVELSCVLAIGKPGSAATSAADMSLVGRIGEIAGTIAAAVAGISGMAAAALAALALTTILLAIRARTPRIGSTVTSLALFAAIAANASELRAALLGLSPGTFGIATTVVVALATAVLAARWIEDVALTVALEKSIDPLAISAEVDREAGHAARRGVSSVDQSSFRLAGALGRCGIGGTSGGSTFEETSLSGQGSPIPSRMPDDEPLPVRTA